MPPLTPEEIEMILAYSQGNVAANSYGSGPDFLSETKNPYDTLGWREGAVSDVFRTAGIYPEDLLGLPQAPEQPEFPEIYQSDVAGMYANNPLIQEWQAAVQGGMDPIRATAVVRQMVTDNPELSQFVPKGVTTDQMGTPKEYDDWGQFSTTVEKIAQDQNRTGREMGQYQAQVDEYNRYYQPTSEFELLGSPELEDYIQSEYGGYQKAVAPRTPTWDPNRIPTDNVEGAQFAMENAYGNRGLATRNHPVPTPANASPMMTPDEVRGIADYKPLDLNVAGTTNALINSFAKKRLADAQQNIQPSQHEMNNRARLQNAYSLLFGEAAPTRDPAKGAQSVNRQLATDARKLKSIDYKKRSAKK